MNAPLLPPNVSTHPVTDSLWRLKAANHLSPVRFEVEPPWIRLVCPAHPSDARSDWDLWNLESQHLKLAVVLHKLLILKHYCIVAGCIILLKETTAMGEYCVYEGVQALKVSLQNIPTSITQPLLACLLPIVHPDAMSSSGKWHTRTHLSVDRIQCGHSHWSAAMSCVFWHCSIWTSMNFFSSS